MIYKEIYTKYKEIINYLIFGFITTIINFISYCICARIIGLEEVTSNILAWFFSVLFAYITNKKLVFFSKTKTKKDLIKECTTFFLGRIISGILCDVGTFALLIKVLNVNDLISKIITQIMVIIVNYIISKFYIFKKIKQSKTK